MAVGSKIKEKLRLLPALPGVYIMKDSGGKIIYVGKAKVLKNRVRQYFHKSANHSPKVEAMVKNIDDFEYIIAENEFEALCLECNLIKENSPKYNILLKDDKHYPFIKISIEDEFPRLSLARKIEKDKSRYFGPYPSSAVVYNTIDLLRNIFKLQFCKRVFPRDIGRGRPCLYYSMHRCDAPCTGNISAEEYREKIENVCRFLDGKHTDLIKTLKKEMLEAAKNEEFEKAADKRDLIESVEKVTNSQKVISASLGDIDIFASVIDDGIVVIEVFYIRGGRLIGSDSFRQDAVMTETPESTLEEFVMSFYGAGAMIPGTVALRDFGDTAALSRWLSEKRGKAVTVKTPVRGDIKKLADMAAVNAEKNLSDYKIELLKNNNNDKALSELAGALGISEPLHRIEAFDISNTSGEENVASMVVFENGKRKTSDYKRFKIKYIVGSNDYECMKEVLVRRFLRYHEKDEKSDFSHLPSLIFVDGGAGHVSAALEALGALDINVPVFGMYKDSHHKTAGLVGKHGEVGLKVGSPAFRLVTYIQDEAHRFAINYHRSLRDKKGFSSELENIEGVGPVRRKALMAHFKTMAKIRSADIAELSEVGGIDERTARNIYDYFRSKK